MIKIYEKDGKTFTRIEKGTKYSTMICGIEMLIEMIMKNEQIGFNIDDILSDIKRIYIRDNKKCQ